MYWKFYFLQNWLFIIPHTKEISIFSIFTLIHFCIENVLRHLPTKHLKNFIILKVCMFENVHYSYIYLFICWKIVPFIYEISILLTSGGNSFLQIIKSPIPQKVFTTKSVSLLQARLICAIQQPLNYLYHYQLYLTLDCSIHIRSYIYFCYLSDCYQAITFNKKNLVLSFTSHL